MDTLYPLTMPGGSYMTRQWYSSVWLVCALAVLTPTSADGKMIVGWVEKARIAPGNLELDAKLDTGADHSSLTVTQIRRFKKEGKRWVNFTVANKDGTLIPIERKVIRRARVKRPMADDIRLVVRMGICVGPVYKEVDVNLADRAEMTQPLLIGRSFLQDSLLVDSSVTFTVDPQCEELSEP